MRWFGQLLTTRLDGALSPSNNPDLVAFGVRDKPDDCPTRSDGLGLLNNRDTLLPEMLKSFINLRRAEGKVIVSLARHLAGLFTTPLLA